MRGHFYFVLINKQTGMHVSSHMNPADWWLTPQSRRSSPCCCCCGWGTLQTVFHGEAPPPDIDRDLPQTSSLPPGAPHSSPSPLSPHIQTWENNHSVSKKPLIFLSMHGSSYKSISNCLVEARSRPPAFVPLSPQTLQTYCIRRVPARSLWLR